MAREAPVTDKKGRGPRAAKTAVPSAGATGGVQLSFFQLDDPVLQQIRDELLNLDIDNLSPLQALNKSQRHPRDYHGEITPE